ncbi:uncharacterized protein B0I36DRAFT_355866 [Microdochium trichocladiopsis]|uniref:Cation-transporting P-type ATPase C-terminal domain-containing protein n=1 Tax=Microdochium trichocladiopsis TaxID=1682393 RepID=A0A9P9BFN5_9PEZI|nr:uncharacterized protein B0I36DRAFT_355866 [Microdochium trichocladiopsis]KAH7012456.1 hypothetical protein B0I36DRAFT_355866 [Microdochium trichocladiopsis]
MWMQIFNLWNNRRIDGKLNIFEGLTRHWSFIGINVIFFGAQLLIIFYGGTPFSIPTTTLEGRPPQSGLQWGIAVGFGLASIPVGIMIRCFPYEFVLKCVPKFMKRRRNRVHRSQVFVKNDLRFLMKFKGGPVNSLTFTNHVRDLLGYAVPSPSFRRPISAMESPMLVLTQPSPLAMASNHCAEDQAISTTRVSGPGVSSRASSHTLPNGGESRQPAEEKPGRDAADQPQWESSSRDEDNDREPSVNNDSTSRNPLSISEIKISLGVGNQNNQPETDVAGEEGWILQMTLHNWFKMLLMEAHPSTILNRNMGFR